MIGDPWLPIGFRLHSADKIKSLSYHGNNWQIFSTHAQNLALVVTVELLDRWVGSGLIESNALSPFEFGGQKFATLVSGPNERLQPVAEARSPSSKSEALAFAHAFKATRQIDKISPLQDSIYAEKISRLLPTYSLSSRTDDDVVLGYWLTGGATTSAKSFRRLSQMLSWLEPSQLVEIVECAGFQVDEMPLAASTPAGKIENGGSRRTAFAPTESFSLPGRKELEQFFSEHIIDIVENRERYKALGIQFPAAVILHGPPGTGKTFAVERLVEYLGWPSYSVNASSVASPFIHETSRKVAEMFDVAIENSPSVLIIDEMEAFLSQREGGFGKHHVEEVAEFLRQIPNAIKEEVLIVAMTNRLDMIDSAILRRGRFDHIVEVGFASKEEIANLLRTLLKSLPSEESVDLEKLSSELAGRPLSDVAFVVREGARLAAKSGKDRLDQRSLLAALASVPAPEGTPRRIGFV